MKSTHRDLCLAVDAVNPTGLWPELPTGVRVAIVHYWLLGYGGGERVVSALLDLFPDADLFALVANDETCAHFAPNRVTTSFLQHVPGSHRYHRHMLPLCPIALEQFDLRGYDLGHQLRIRAGQGSYYVPRHLSR